MSGSTFGYDGWLNLGTRCAEASIILIRLAIVDEFANGANSASMLPAWAPADVDSSVWDLIRSSSKV